jgi:hypothetical protein
MLNKHSITELHPPGSGEIILEGMVQKWLERFPSLFRERSRKT